MSMTRSSTRSRNQKTRSRFSTRSWRCWSDSRGGASEGPVMAAIMGRGPPHFNVCASVKRIRLEELPEPLKLAAERRQQPAVVAEDQVLLVVGRGPSRPVVDAGEDHALVEDRELVVHGDRCGGWRDGGRPGPHRAAVP